MSILLRSVSKDRIVLLYIDFRITSYNVCYTKLLRGFSVIHLSTPAKSFFENSEAYLPVKYSFTVSGDYNIKDDLWVEPQFMAMFQQDYREVNAGGLLRFDYNPVSLQSVYFGGLVRARDAGIVVFGLKYHNVRMTLNRNNFV